MTYCYQSGYSSTVWWVMEYEQEVVIEEVCLCLSHAENKLMISVLISNFYLIID